MRPVVVVVLAPRFDLYAVPYILKPVRTEAVLAKRPVEVLDKEALDGLAKSDEAQRHATLSRLEIEDLADEFRVERTQERSSTE